MGETRSYEFDFRLSSVLNARWHWRERDRYIRESRAFIAAYWKMSLGDWRPALPCRVTLTRIAHKAMDGDNLQGAFKGCRDQLAAIIGLDDADPMVTWLYSQESGKPRTYAVRVEIEEIDRNINPYGTGKYALLNLRRNRIEWGNVGDEDEFFVIKLKDKFAQAALRGYVDEVDRNLLRLKKEGFEAGGHAQNMIMAEVRELEEWREEISALAERSGPDHPECKRPD